VRDPLGGAARDRHTMHRLHTLLFVALGVLACRSRTAASDQGATPTAKAQSPSVAPDTVGLFDATGYYAPEDSLTLGGVGLSAIGLQNVDYSYDSATHAHTRPKVLDHPSAILVFDSAGTGPMRPVPCASALVSADTLSLNCPGTVIGDIRIEGHFTTRDMTINEVALIARVTIRLKGEVRHDKEHRFTWFNGD
jgi:hypothetical protein